MSDHSMLRGAETAAKRETAQILRLVPCRPPAARPEICADTKEGAMKFEVKGTGSGSGCEAEGKHRGYLARVVAHGDVRADKCLVHVYLQKMGDFGKAPTTMEKLDTAGMTAASVDDAFAKGFDLAEKTIDSLTNP